jgi:hypothetical protein
VVAPDILFGNPDIICGERGRFGLWGGGGVEVGRVETGIA